MIINMRVPNEAVKQIGFLLRKRFKCSFPGDCEICENIIGCECLKTLGDACCDNEDNYDYICEVTINEE